MNNKIKEVYKTSISSNVATVKEKKGVTLKKS
jgi:hypothetical protein